MLEIPISFFQIIPSAFYNIIRLFIFFVFDYKLIGGEGSALNFVNPFVGESFSFTIPPLDFGYLDEILNAFGFDFSITFFELLTGPGLLIVLAYAVIKYLIPV